MHFFTIPKGCLLYKADFRLLKDLNDGRTLVFLMLTAQHDNA